MSDFKADPPAMEDFSDRTVGRRDSIDQVRSGLNATRLPRDAFGYVPGVGGQVHDAYEEFVTGCVEATEMASHTFLSLAQSVHKAAQLMAQTDQFNADDIANSGPLHPGVQ